MTLNREIRELKGEKKNHKNHYINIIDRYTEGISELKLSFCVLRKMLYGEIDVLIEMLYVGFYGGFK